VTDAAAAGARDELETAIVEALGKAWRTAIAYTASDLAGRGVPLGYPEIAPETRKLLAAVDAERERADKAEAKAAAYENGITWGASCLSCSAVLDSCIAETNRREGAEGKLAEAVLLLGEIRELARSWAGMAAADDWGGPAAFKAAADCGRSVLKIIDADAPTDDDESARPPRTTASEGGAQ
jgi:hypothetical protein